MRESGKKEKVERGKRKKGEGGNSIKAILEVNLAKSRKRGGWVNEHDEEP